MHLRYSPTIFAFFLFFLVAFLGVVLVLGLIPFPRGPPCSFMVVIALFFLLVVIVIAFFAGET